MADGLDRPGRRLLTHASDGCLSEDVRKRPPDQFQEYLFIDRGGNTLRRFAGAGGISELWRSHSLPAITKLCVEGFFSWSYSFESARLILFKYQAQFA